ncbi:MAG: phosphate signaling complex protein PhoU [Elusimicrobiota bacterium]|jgi:phosphate transport system protein|nr:phosphate signaling complex protein PhoU [Elusimicrobiota bacterium]
MIEEQIILLQKNIVEYGSLIENMLAKSTRGVFERNNELLEEVINADEPAANKTELALDEKAVNIIAKFQPAAKNLRMIISIIKMNNDLERIGDHCVNIAQSGLYLNSYPAVKTFTDLPKMKDIVTRMLNKSSKALIGGDINLAADVLAIDDKADNYKKLIIDELMSFICGKNQNIRCILEIINITNNLERIADLSTNVCEDIIYMESGEVVKHHNANNYKNADKPAA